ncbi:MAG: iron ABC transporter permease [Trueperaceae bacterium]|nr:MAG: iron ABC transporter permease [Trueperaceae bacterium]
MQFGVASGSLAPLLVSATALVLISVLAVSVGSVKIPLTEVFASLSRGLMGTTDGVQDTIVWQVRVPRVLLAAVVGSALALAGAGYQGVFRNPLADPYLLGASSGAAFGAASIKVLGASVPLLARIGVPVSAFGCALLAVVLVIALARQGPRVPLTNLILAGAVLGSVFTAATSFVMLSDPERATGVLSWLLGSFGTASWTKLAAVTPFVGVALVAISTASRALNLLQLGEKQAAQLGLPVEAFKYGLIAVATLATAAAVSVAGIIGFVGLLVPHAVRLAFGPDHRLLVPLAAVLGAAFLVAADLAARTVIAPAELPIGVITALIGGPFFLYLLRRGRAL